MPSIWSSEQRNTVSCLYKIGRKLVLSKSHGDFLCECLSKCIIPKAFLLKNNIPGNKVENERRIRDISQNAMIYEKEKHQNNYDKFRVDLETAKDNLKNQFSQEIVVSELNRFEKHLSKIEMEMAKKKQKKMFRDEGFIANFINNESSDVTIALDDEHQFLALKQKTYNGRNNGDLSSSSESTTENSPAFEVYSGDDSLNVTIAHDDEHHIEAHLT